METLTKPTNKEVEKLVDQFYKLDEKLQGEFINHIENDGRIRNTPTKKWGSDQSGQKNVGQSARDQKDGVINRDQEKGQPGRMSNTQYTH